MRLSQLVRERTREGFRGEWDGHLRNFVITEVVVAVSGVIASGAALLLLGATGGILVALVATLTALGLCLFVYWWKIRRRVVEQIWQEKCDETKMALSRIGSLAEELGQCTSERDGALEACRKLDQENGVRRLRAFNEAPTSKGLRVLIYYTDRQDSGRAKDLESVFRVAGWDVEPARLPPAEWSLDSRPKEYTRIMVEGRQARFVRARLRQVFYPLGNIHTADAEAADLKPHEVRLTLFYPPPNSEQWPANLQQELSECFIN